MNRLLNVTSVNRISLERCGKSRDGTRLLEFLSEVKLTRPLEVLNISGSTSRKFFAKIAIFAPLVGRCYRLSSVKKQVNAQAAHRLSGGQKAYEHLAHRAQRPTCPLTALSRLAEDPLSHGKGQRQPVQRQTSASSAVSGAHPKHVAIIMDGNGRWALQRGLSPRMGHQAGAKAVRTVIEECLHQGIAALTVCLTFTAFPGS